MMVFGAPYLRRRLRAFSLGFAVVAAILANVSVAQNYPNKPVRIVVPFTPGGSSDILARAIGQKLTEKFGQSFVIENIAGAGGSIGADRVAKAPADGYTLLMGHIGTLAVNPALYPNLPYDPVKSFAPVAWVANVPNVLVVHPSVSATSLPALIALAKSSSSTLNYGSGGNGSAAHIATEYLKLQSGAAITHVPYKGTAPAVTDVLGGNIQVLFTGAPAVLPHIKAGKMRALAVSSAKRLPQLPDVPTVAEMGYAGFEADQWYGVVAPAGTPAEIIAKLNAEINAALQSRELSAKLDSEGAQPAPASPQSFGEHIKREIARWKPVVVAGKITAQ
jgi:tripartite-type tricarboxylate transporter receptor subunit TctC